MLSLGLARVSEAAAIAAAKLVGRGDEKAADQAAVDAMRTQLNLLDIKGVVVIGEGERDEAPMLYIGEEVGTGNGPGVDIALDPLEGTTLTAKDMPNALAVIAVGPARLDAARPRRLHGQARDRPRLSRGLVSPRPDPDRAHQDAGPRQGHRPSGIMVCVLERPRHQALIDEIRATGARIRLITDGDVAGVIHCAEPAEDRHRHVHGLGRRARGRARRRGAEMHGRPDARPAAVPQRRRAQARHNAGIEDLDKVYTRDEMVTEHVIFAATGVTDGSIVRGARRDGEWLETETILMRSKTGSIRRLFYRQRNQ